MNLFDQLKQMQWKQLQHDEKYHKEIWLLDVQRRSVHMVLHFAKYSAKINNALYRGSNDDLFKSLIDVLIIATSTLNIFNSSIYSIALSERERSCQDIGALAESILESLNIVDERKDLDISMRVNGVIAEICKSAEALDHLENVEFRRSIIEGASKLLRYALAFLCLIGVKDVPGCVAERLVSVEKKSLFFDEIGNYISGYN